MPFRHSPNNHRPDTLTLTWIRKRLLCDRNTLLRWIESKESVIRHPPSNELQDIRSWTKRVDRDLLISRLAERSPDPQRISEFLTRVFQAPDDQPLLIKPKEAASLLGKDVTQLRALRKNGFLRGYQISQHGDWYYLRDEIHQISAESLKPKTAATETKPLLQSAHAAVTNDRKSQGTLDLERQSSASTLANAYHGFAEISPPAHFQSLRLFSGLDAKILDDQSSTSARNAIAQPIARHRFYLMESRTEPQPANATAGTGYTSQERPSPLTPLGDASRAEADASIINVVPTANDYQAKRPASDRAHARSAPAPAPKRRDVTDRIGFYYLRLAEAADYCRCSEKTLRRAITNKRLRCRQSRPNAALLFCREDLDRYLDGEDPQIQQQAPRTYIEPPAIQAMLCMSPVSRLARELAGISHS